MITTLATNKNSLKNTGCSLVCCLTHDAWKPGNSMLLVKRTCIKYLRAVGTSGFFFFCNLAIVFQKMKNDMILLLWNFAKMWVLFFLKGILCPNIKLPLKSQYFSNKKNKKNIKVERISPHVESHFSLVVFF
jgi:hypothetical protein